MISIPKRDYLMLACIASCHLHGKFHRFSAACRKKAFLEISWSYLGKFFCKQYQWNSRLPHRHLADPAHLITYCLDYIRMGMPADIDKISRSKIHVLFTRCICDMHSFALNYRDWPSI